MKTIKIERYLIFSLLNLLCILSNAQGPKGQWVKVSAFLTSTRDKRNIFADTAVPDSIKGINRIYADTISPFGEAHLSGKTSNRRPLTYTNIYPDEIPTGGHEDFLNFCFSTEKDVFLNLKDIGLKSIKLTVNNQIIYTQEVIHPVEDSLEIFTVPLNCLEGMDNDEIIQVEITLDNPDSFRLSKHSIYYFKFYEKITWYGAFNKQFIPGFWFPTGMFATNFNRTSTGITFAPMPIGLAFGAKYTPMNSRFYIGGSLCLNWLIYQETEASAENINFQAMSLGALFDVSNYVTIGINYGIDLTTNKKNPGLLFVVGIAPGTLNFIKSSKK